MFLEEDQETDQEITADEIESSNQNDKVIYEQDINIQMYEGEIIEGR